MEVELKITPKTFLRLSSFERQPDGSGGSKLEISSGKFQYATEQFYFDNLAKFELDMIRLNESLSGEATLQFHYESEYIKFEAKPLGRILLTGEFLEYGMYEQSIKVCFEFDQSYLANLIESLSIVVSETYS